MLTFSVLAEALEQAGRNGKATGKSVTESGVIHKSAGSRKSGENRSISARWRIANGSCYWGGAGAKESGMGWGRSEVESRVK